MSISRDHAFFLKFNLGEYPTLAKAMGFLRKADHVGSWYHGKNPKNHLNYFKILQTFHASTKSSSNLTFLWAFLVQIKRFFGVNMTTKRPHSKR
jgi:hypothetical protein